MLNLDHLTVLHNQSSRTLAQMQTRASTLDATVAKIKADDSRSTDYKIKEIARLKTEALPAMGADLKALQNNAAAIATSKAAWSSKPYLLSKQQFDKDAGIDAAIRLSHSTELQRMPNDLRLLVAANAMEERNLPMLHQVWLSLPEADRGSIDLESVVVPNQNEALRALSIIASAIPQAELAAKSALVNGASPIDRMIAARDSAAA